jgi:hypothetical protein
MRFTDLNRDVLTMIADLVSEKQDILSLMLSCRVLYAIMEPCLFSDVEIHHYEQVVKLNAVITQQPARGRWIRAISLNFKWFHTITRLQSRAEDATLAFVRILAEAPGIRELQIDEVETALQAQASLTIAICKLSQLHTLLLDEARSKHRGLGKSTSALLRSLHAPLHHIDLRRLCDEDVHPLELLLNFQSTLQTVILGLGTFGPYDNLDAQWPQLHSLTLWYINPDLPVLDRAFPNLQKLSVTGDFESFDDAINHLTGHPTPHTCTTLQRLRHLSLDLPAACYVALSNCVVDLLEFTSSADNALANDVIHSGARRMQPEILRFSVSPAEMIGLPSLLRSLGQDLTRLKVLEILMDDDDDIEPVSNILVRDFKSGATFSCCGR